MNKIVTENLKSNHTSRNKNEATNWNPSKSFLHHKLSLYGLSRQEGTFAAKENVSQLYFQDNINIYKTIIKEITNLRHYNLISLLWLVSNLKRRENSKEIRIWENSHTERNRKHSPKEENHISLKDPTPPHSNTTKRSYDQSLALNIDHEIQARNYLPATDIKRV